MNRVTNELRVLVFTPGEIFGGAERQALTLMDALRSEGVVCELLALHDADLTDRARRADYTVHVLPSRGSFDLRTVSALRQYLRLKRGYVLSVHGYRASVCLALAASPSAFRVVKTEHGHGEHDHFPTLQRLKQRVYRIAENWAMRRLAGCIVYVTDDLRRRCEHEHRGIERRVIHNGIAPIDRSATQRPPELDRASFNVLMVGRLEKVKGIDCAIRALASSDMPPSTRLHLVGEGAEQSSLQALTAQLGQQNRVTFHGFRTNSYDFIAHADCLLMPSLHEGLPYTVMEAMALGTPIVASRVGGLAEVLVDGQTALLIPPNDAEALALAIRTLHADPTRRAALRERALAEVNEKLSARTMAAAYIAAFTEPAPGR